MTIRMPDDVSPAARTALENIKKVLGPPSASDVVTRHAHDPRDALTVAVLLREAAKCYELNDLESGLGPLLRGFEYAMQLRVKCLESLEKDDAQRKAILAQIDNTMRCLAKHDNFTLGQLLMHFEANPFASKFKARA